MLASPRKGNPRIANADGSHTQVPVHENLGVSLLCFAEILSTGCDSGSYALPRHT